MGWICGIVVFGLFYNNSDSQYFIQGVVPAAMIVAVVPVRFTNSVSGRLSLLALAGCLLWNVGYAYSAHISYPRAERMAALSNEVEGGGLVIYPGSDTTGHLLHLLPDTLYEERLSLMTWAGRYSSEQGLVLLADSIRRVFASGRDVRLVSVYGAPTEGQPWALLHDRGYGSSELTKLVEKCRTSSLDSTGSGFGTRRVLGEPGCLASPPE
jgi:hypothetical protein